MNYTLEDVGNLTYILMSFQNNTNEQKKVEYDSSSKNALLYIVCVLMFYAFSIVILMIKYVRREREEADQRNFFNEFIKRDKFCNAQYQNTLLMQKLLNQKNLKFICQSCPPIPGQSHRSSEEQDNKSDHSRESFYMDSQSNDSCGFDDIESQSNHSFESDDFVSQSGDGFEPHDMNSQSNQIIYSKQNGKDPMKPLLLIPGKPHRTSEDCENQSKHSESVDIDSQSNDSFGFDDMDSQSSHSFESDDFLSQPGDGIESHAMNSQSNQII